MFFLGSCFLGLVGAMVVRRDDSELGYGGECLDQRCLRVSETVSYVRLRVREVAAVLCVCVS